MHIGRIAPIFIILISAFAVSLIISIMLPNISTRFRPLTGSILGTNYQSLVCGAGSSGTCPVPGSECAGTTCQYSSCNCVVNENQNVPSGTTYTFNTFKINSGKIVNVQTSVAGSGVDGGFAGRGGAGGASSGSTGTTNNHGSTGNFNTPYSSGSTGTTNNPTTTYVAAGGGGGPGTSGGVGGGAEGGGIIGDNGGGNSGGGGAIHMMVIGQVCYPGCPTEDILVNGGSGGGGIAIVAGSIEIDGEMHADGGAGTSGGNGASGGGGGGLIILSADSISVSGHVTANGGAAGQASYCGSGGGGGGYIKIISTSAVSTSQGALSVAGGAPSASTCGLPYVLNGFAATPGSAGNIDYVTVPVSTTTTISTTITSTTSTLSTTTTTTGAPAGTFSHSNFACSSITTGWQCNITYSNNLGEDAVVVFLVTNTNGHIVSSTSPVATQTASNVGTMFQCSSLTSGTYYIYWTAYRQSDTSFAHAVDFSKSTERQLIVC